MLGALILLATTPAHAFGPPFAIEGQYCDLYGPWCDSVERYIVQPGGTVEHAYSSAYGGFWPATVWGTWTWDPATRQLSLVNDNPLGFPVEMSASESVFGGIHVAIYEDFGGFIGTSDVFYFEFDRIRK